MWCSIVVGIGVLVVLLILSSVSLSLPVVPLHVLNLCTAMQSRQPASQQSPRPLTSTANARLNSLAHFSIELNGPRVRNTL